MKLIVTFFLGFLGLIASCLQGVDQVWAAGLPVSRDTISVTSLGTMGSGVLLIKDTIDLKNKTCRIPAGVTLRFCGGYLKNGTLVGDMTKIRCCRPCFNRVRIQGTWNVPVIKSSLFDDLSYDNALKDVLALSHPRINNKIVIKRGFYQVSALWNNDVCLSINSNTELVLDGTIQMTPNAYKCYNIIQIAGSNIKIRGKGMIVGDKHTHTGKSGEWGMGVNIKNAHNVAIKAITIKDCWGDCIYIGNGSTNITVEKCKLDHGRRQGISITSANGVVIKNCEISNVSGTLPEFAIDVEPNENETVDNVVVDHVVVSNCKGGVMSAKWAKNTRIGTVFVQNCTILSETHEALRFVNCESVTIKNNVAKRIKNKPVLECNRVKRLAVVDNTFIYGKGSLKGVKSSLKRFVLGESNSVVKIVSCDNVLAKDNKQSKIRQ